jgi:hypothetical protein
MANAIFMESAHIDKGIECISEVEAPIERFMLPPIMELSLE